MAVDGAWDKAFVISTAIGLIWYGFSKEFMQETPADDK
jgi:hypothetical protein